MPRYKLTVAYDGTNFHGWQKQQPPETEPLRTVQGVLEDAISHVMREPIHIVGASRTDSGVHARGQIACFTSDREIPLEKIPAAITSRLPDDVQVLGAEIVHPEFSPISECTGKGYRYTIAYGRRLGITKPLFERHFVTWTAYELDAKKMHQAAQYLVGEHDFASFTRLNHGRESTVREVYECTVIESGEREVQIDISGNGFLYNMVRIMGGTLLDVGRGKYEPEKVKKIVEARNREAAGPTLPPEGLCLEWVTYEDEPS